MKISDALLYIVYKNNNKITTAELLQYTKLLVKYDLLSIGEDRVSCELTDKGLEKLKQSNLI